MAKVSSFRKVKLSTDVKQLKGVSEFWVVQFVGAPGIDFWTSMHKIEKKSNVHFICCYEYSEQYKCWMVNQYKARFLVENFDFETGIVTVNWHGQSVEFYADGEI